MRFDPYAAPRAEVGSSGAPEPEKRTYGVFIAFGALFVIDTVAFNQGLIALIGSVVLLLVVLATGLRRPLLGLKLLAAVALGPAVIGTNALQNDLAKHRAEGIIGAVYAYRDAEGHYPKSLEDLVPGQLSSVPRAKYTLNGDFSYRVQDDDATLEYVALPPFGRPFYKFESRRWGYLD